MRNLPGDQKFANLTCTKKKAVTKACPRLDLIQLYQKAGTGPEVGFTALHRSVGQYCRLATQAMQLIGLYMYATMHLVCCVNNCMGDDRLQKDGF